jgi:hypothetical protein
VINSPQPQKSALMLERRGWVAIDTLSYGRSGAIDTLSAQ